MSDQIDPAFKAAYRETQGQPVDAESRRPIVAAQQDGGLVERYTSSDPEKFTAFDRLRVHAASDDYDFFDAEHAEEVATWCSEAATALAEKDAQYERLAGRMDAMAADNQRLRAECEGLRAWRPIETAPKDGAWIIAYRPSKGFGYIDRVVIVRWDDEVSAWVWPDEAFDVYEEDFAERVNATSFGDRIDPFEDNSFTHWMPLAPAPAALSQKETGA
jgi:hypothetical protein